MSKRREKLIFKQVRDANLKYNLIENQDRVAVGMSGGKDSFTMLYFLHLLTIYTPLKFQLFPIYIDLGWNNQISSLQQFCASLKLPLIQEKTNIGQVVFKWHQDKSPCSLCANLRRGALNRVAKNYECNKVALGHHMDDAVNTMFLSMLFEGRFNLFKPKTYLDRKDITIIRPMIYVAEKDIKLLIDSWGIMPVKNNCPADGNTKRDEVGQLVNDIDKRFPGAKRRFLSSIENAGPDTFWQ